jgi:hypothetical protein
MEVAMKASVISALVVSSAFAVALTAAAQAPAGEKPAAQTAAPKEHTMAGCLQKGAEADTWVVANTDPKGPKMIGIVSSTAKLDPHVGHKIEITGTGVPAKEAESAAKKPAKADHYMNITAVKMVSATCP